MSSNENKETAISVSTEEKSGGITATVVTDAGKVYTGRSHWSDNFAGDVSEDRAIRDATRKVNH